ncbi:MAG: hypothetical protein ACYS5V_05230 [Planctomycetota bacterium]|jgi:hypothetical protein
MRRRSHRRWRCWRAGLTLIETVAGIGLLGTVLVAALLVEIRCKRQSAAAARRLESVRAAEALLAGWWAQPDGLPRDGSGRIEATRQLLWRTRTVPHEAAEALGCEVVRLQVGPEREVMDAKAWVTVDVVVPRKTGPDDEGGGVHAD